ncbi:MAG: GNAT family N-acetyltransferase [Clostridia bacterium]|nr:GNAT family N-acetyltransferase [Clostridia bacterium]
MQFYTGIFSCLPRLETDRLILRPLQMDDAKDMYAYARDPEVSRHVLWDAHKSIWETRHFLRFARNQYRRGFPGSFAMELKESGRMIGTIGFMWVNPDYKSAEVGYSLSRDYWNRGLMTEALEATLRFGFEELKLNRIEAQHDTENPASGKVMAHCGMQFEGVMRSRVMNKGVFRDVAVYAVLKNDWQKSHI